MPTPDLNLRVEEAIYRVLAVRHIVFCPESVAYCSEHQFGLARSEPPLWLDGSMMAGC